MLAQVELTPTMQQKLITDLTAEERLDLFIRVTDYLREQGVYFKTISEKIRMPYKRMKNIRSDSGPNVKPTIPEVRAVFEKFEDRLTEFITKEGEPSPQDQRLISLEERIEMLEAENEISRKELLRKIELLEAENELLRNKLKK